ncbi:enoyl-CoA hydratase/isomerase family protein [Nocardioides sp. Bht2]|uniref:enoyl-CoA hydratase/isomerase family protein n=1 Tax=Nocardioides sp. Bht2 TaxID=3392297 RepID=UPI0039B4FE82
MNTAVDYARADELAGHLVNGPLLDLAADASARPAALLVDLDDVEWTEDLVEELCALLDGVTPVLIGASANPVPEIAAPVLDRLTLTLAPEAPGDRWVAGEVAPVLAGVRANPDAALALHGLLRTTAVVPVPTGLVAEAAAYSALLAGPEFGRWLAAAPQRRPGTSSEVLQVERIKNTLRLTLNDPGRRNAFGHTLRDALLDAFRLPILDPSITAVEVLGNGPSFCAGGDLSEFGTAADPMAAYRARLGRSVAAALHQIADRTRIDVHGACVGAGIELAAFARDLIATPDAWFCLPELGMGLVPGAGGTVSVARRIGTARTAWMVLTGARVDATTALDWGLVDDVQ